MHCMLSTSGIQYVLSARGRRAGAAAAAGRAPAEAPPVGRRGVPSTSLSSRVDRVGLLPLLLVWTPGGRTASGDRGGVAS
jgi:hypothetical protein